jgi:hypothetical protein
MQNLRFFTSLWRYFYIMALQDKKWYNVNGEASPGNKLASQQVKDNTFLNDVCDVYTLSLPGVDAHSE